MPSSPKISKESMIQAALEILIEEGNAGVTIKTVANRLGCSTQPISWQFGGMDGLRKELLAAAEKYVVEKYYPPTDDVLSSFGKSGWGAVDLAIDEPNLFRFLFLGESGRTVEGGFLSLPDMKEREQIQKRIAELVNISLEDAGNLMTTMILYTQGLNSLLATGIVRDDRATIHRMVRETGFTFLRGLGVSAEQAENLLQVSYGELRGGGVNFFKKE